MRAKRPDESLLSGPRSDRWDEGPCYICKSHVPPAEGWHREEHDGTRRHWCPRHRPVWSWGERECIQHGYDYSAICPICGGWWAEQATPEERRLLVALAEPLVERADVKDRTIYSDRWSCPICLRTIAFRSFKRHVNAHERRGIPTQAVNEAWREFIEIRGWPRG